jgi:multiple antibiotic resistance protein
MIGFIFIGEDFFLLDFFYPFVKGFLQIAVAIDVVGILPLYLGMVEHVPEDRKKTVLRASLLAGLVVGIGFTLLGRAAFVALGIQMGDFQIAGGLVLLLIGVLDLVGEEKRMRRPEESFGIVPLGIPLIVGPATISVMFLLVDQTGTPATLAAFVANLIIVGLTFRFAPYVSRILGKDGMKAISKVTMLILIAVGIRMLRMGIISAFFK